MEYLVAISSYYHSFALSHEGFLHASSNRMLISFSLIDMQKPSQGSVTVQRAAENTVLKSHVMAGYTSFCVLKILVFVAVCVEWKTHFSLINFLVGSHPQVTGFHLCQKDSKI